MTGIHHCLLLEETAHDKTPYFDAGRFYDRAGYTVLDKVELSDAVFFHIADSLAWLPTIRPRGQSKSDYRGLHRYGITEILEADKLNNVILSWISLFSLAPDKIVLTGEYVFPDGRLSEGTYEENVLDKSALLEGLMSLSRLCRKRIDSDNPRLHVVHFGINATLSLTGTGVYMLQDSSDDETEIIGSSD